MTLTTVVQTGIAQVADVLPAQALAHLSAHFVEYSPLLLALLLWLWSRTPDPSRRTSRQNVPAAGALHGAG